MRMILAIAAAVALTIGIPASGYGATVTGDLNATGSVRVTATSIDFLPLDGGDGNIRPEPEDPGTGSFAGLGGEVGLIQDLFLGPNPVGVPFSLPDWITFDNGLTFELTFIEPGTEGPCLPGADACTPPNSPFDLANTSTGWTGSFDVRGFVSDGSDSDPSAFTGTFSTQQSNGDTIDDVLAFFAQNGFVQASYSAHFDVKPEGPAPIPEPGSVFLIGAGLLGLGFIRRRKVN